MPAFPDPLKRAAVPACLVESWRLRRFQLPPLPSPHRGYRGSAARPHLPRAGHHGHRDRHGLGGLARPRQPGAGALRRALAQQVAARAACPPPDLACLHAVQAALDPVPDRHPPLGAPDEALPHPPLLAVRDAPRLTPVARPKLGPPAATCRLGHPAVLPHPRSHRDVAGRAAPTAAAYNPPRRRPVLLARVALGAAAGGVRLLLVEHPPHVREPVRRILRPSSLAVECATGAVRQPDRAERSRRGERSPETEAELAGVLEVRVPLCPALERQVPILLAVAKLALAPVLLAEKWLVRASKWVLAVPPPVPTQGAELRSQQEHEGRQPPRQASAESLARAPVAEVDGEPRQRVPAGAQPRSRARLPAQVRSRVDGSAVGS